MMETEKVLRQVENEILVIAKDHHLAEFQVNDGYEHCRYVARYRPGDSGGKGRVDAWAQDSKKAVLPNSWASHRWGFRGEGLETTGRRGEQVLVYSLYRLKARALKLAGDDGRLQSLFALVAMFLRKQASFADLRKAIA